MGNVASQVASSGIPCATLPMETSPDMHILSMPPVLDSLSSEPSQSAPDEEGTGKEILVREGLIEYARTPLGGVAPDDTDRQRTLVTRVFECSQYAFIKKNGRTMQDHEVMAGLDIAFDSPNVVEEYVNVLSDTLKLTPGTILFWLNVRVCGLITYLSIHPLTFLSGLDGGV